MKMHDVNRVIFSDIIDTMQIVQDYCRLSGTCKNCAFENDTDDPHYGCFLSGSSPQYWKLDKMRRPEIEEN